MKALSIVKGASSEKLAPFVTSCPCGIPNPMDSKVGIGVGGLCCAVDEDGSTSHWFHGRVLEQGDMPVFLID